MNISIGNNSIGTEHPTYFIADIAANHDGSLERAKELIFLAAEAGANAAKFQNFVAETIVSDYGFENLNAGLGHQAKWKKSVVEVYREASLPLEWTEELQKACDEAEIDYFTTPYDLNLVDYLSNYVCAWKLGSGDITWHEMISKLAKDNKPLLLATGATTMEEVNLAMDVALRETNKLVLMQCNTNYTGNIDNISYSALNVLKTYREKFPNTILGLSDHTPGDMTVLGAVSLGARVIEKHFTDDNNREGPDHPFAMNPQTWSQMVERTRWLESALGCHEKMVMPNEEETVVVQRRAIRSAKDLNSGSIIKLEDLVVLRPCPPDALEPYKIDTLIGQRLIRDIPAGDCVRNEDVECPKSP
ncbi:N-acetylneuraminate synthase family protein [Kiloniella sp.]|uniref:N-acetylneuraminate synthase family protein n=1 Tax=Kiloniella sp. TaxID=1938587 RepID=UPI003A9055DE